MEHQQWIFWIELVVGFEEEKPMLSVGSTFLAVQMKEGQRDRLLCLSSYPLSRLSQFLSLLILTHGFNGGGQILFRLSAYTKDWHFSRNPPRLQEYMVTIKEPSSMNWTATGFSSWHSNIWLWRHYCVSKSNSFIL